MGQKVIIRFRWESWLSSASRNHLTTFCRGNKVFVKYQPQGGINPTTPAYALA